MMWFKRLVHRINQHFLLRNIVLAVCGVIVFLFVVSLLLNLFTRHGQQYTVPDLVGTRIDETRSLTAEAHLQLVTIDSLFVPGEVPGAILDQNPKPGARVKSGRKVFVVINSVSPKTDIIPYVTGYSLRQAKNLIESKGFTIDRLIYQPDMANNNVIGQRYDGKEIVRGSTLTAPLGSSIVLTVGRSAGAPLPSIPKVVGLTLREAKSRLWEVGFNVGEVRKDTDVTPRNEDQARIYRQTPGQQARADYGAKIALWITTNEKTLFEGSKKSDTEARKLPPPEQEEQPLSETELNALLAE